ncbi:MAG TPA: hypothetical protein GYA07_02100 [Verrucomicrobia bacterium]|nr:hypothetical protein [Verrucomicrobiota bacterium]HOB33872.1 hypothetical protein [Verrucomicrobiota bacterium]HOP96047.1 hypothetical protein [Verrucomicrobiota bacterium]HPU57588.1 hypothetical protein [Verrucomicrobiota bacterium]
MNEETQLKLQAFVDGELPEAEARAMASLVARDSEANALAAELRNTRRAIKSAEPNVRVPESREFYWSKISRQIAQLEREPAPVTRPSIWSLLRRVLVPAGALAALALAGLLTLQSQRVPGTAAALTATETAMADASTFTYRDFDSGTTLVWMSFPPER